MTTGSVDGGPEGASLFQGALASARMHGMAHEVLTGMAVNERFPGYRMEASPPHCMIYRRGDRGLES